MKLKLIIFAAIALNAVTLGYYDGKKLDIEIRCPSNSAAEQYAIEKGFSYTTI